MNLHDINQTNHKLMVQLLKWMMEAREELGRLMELISDNLERVDVEISDSQYIIKISRCTGPISDTIKEETTIKREPGTV